MAVQNPFTIEPTASLAFSRGLGQLGSAYMQKQQQQEQRAALAQEAQDVLASGDPLLMSQFMVANPQIAQGFESALQFKDQATKQNAVESAQRILQGEDPQVVLRDRAAFVSRAGGDPTQTLEALDDTPEQIKQSALMVLTANKTPQEIKAMQSVGLLPTAEESMTPYQQETIDIKKTALEQRKLENEARKLEQQLKREDNDLKREELQLKIQDRRTKLEQGQKDIQQSLESDLSTIENTLNTVEQLKTGGGLEAAVGASSILPTIPGSKAANFEARLEQLKSQQFLNEIGRLKGMGALSDNEGRKLASAANALELSMSENEFRRELDYIEATMKKARDKVAGKLPETQEVAQPETQVVDWSSL